MDSILNELLKGAFKGMMSGKEGHTEEDCKVCKVKDKCPVRVGTNDTEEAGAQEEYTVISTMTAEEINSFMNLSVARTMADWQKDEVVEAMKKHKAAAVVYKMKSELFWEEVATKYNLDNGKDDLRVNSKTMSIEKRTK